MTLNSGFDAIITTKTLLREALSGALATLMPGTGDPYCSLVNVATSADGAPLLLISTLAVHTRNLLADSRASLMLDARNEGDPLEGARIMLMGKVAATDDPSARRRYLARHPEAGDVKQSREPLVRHRHVDMLEPDDIAEILGRAIEVLLHVHGSFPRTSCYWPAVFGCISRAFCSIAGMSDAIRSSSSPAAISG